MSGGPYRGTVVYRDPDRPRPMAERRSDGLYLSVPFEYGGHYQWMDVEIDEIDAKALVRELTREIDSHDPLPGVPNLFVGKK